MNWRDKPRVRFLQRSQLYAVRWNGVCIFTPQPTMFVCRFADEARWLARGKSEATPAWAHKAKQIL